MKSCGFSNYRLAVSGLLLSITLMPVFAYGQELQTLADTRQWFRAALVCSRHGQSGDSA